MSEKGAQKTRIAYLELVRIIACFFVIVNHTNSGIFMSQTPGGKTWWVSLCYFFMCKTAVPLFLMASGAVLLGRVDENEKHLKRILRIVADLVLFSLMMYLYGTFRSGGEVDLLEFFKRIIQQNVSNAYWYLYLYLGILLMLPLFQRLSVNMGRRAYRYLIFLSVVFLGAMPIVTHYFPGAFVHPLFPETFLPVYAGLLFLGYYLAHEIELKHSYAAVSAVLFFAMLLFEVCATYMEYQKNPEDYLFYDNRTLLTVTVTAASLFYLARWFESVVHTEWFWRAVVSLGGCTFGIYLLSDLFIEIYAMGYLALMARMHVLLAVVAYELLVFFTCAAITAICRKIPYIKRLL